MCVRKTLFSFGTEFSRYYFDENNDGGIVESCASNEDMFTINDGFIQQYGLKDLDEKEYLIPFKLISFDKPIVTKSFKLIDLSKKTVLHIFGYDNSDFSMSFSYHDSRKDTDNDGTPDEIDAFPEDGRYQKDTDKDGMPDRWENAYHLNADSDEDKNTDADADGLSNLLEFLAHTNPEKEDSDSDGFNDGLEVVLFSDPTDKDSFPPPAPLNVKVTIYQTDPSSLILTWDSVSGNAGDSYAVCYGTTNMSDIKPSDFDICNTFDGTKRQLIDETVFYSH